MAHSLLFLLSMGQAFADDQELLHEGACSDGVPELGFLQPAAKQGDRTFEADVSTFEDGSCAVQVATKFAEAPLAGEAVAWAEAPVVSASTEDYLSSLSDGDKASLVVVLNEQLSLPDLPRFGHGEFLEYEAWETARDAVIAERSALIENAQVELVQPLIAAGGQVESLWLFNAFEVVGTVEALRPLLDDERVKSVDTLGTDDLEFSFDNARSATGLQVQQLIDNGFDGNSSPSAGRVHVAVLDVGLDTDHPAWRSNSSPSSSRLVDARIWAPFIGWHNSGSSTVGGSSPSSNNHGNGMVATLTADLMDGQHSGIANPERKSGMSPESMFTFVQRSGGTSLANEIQQGVSRGPDIINLSGATGSSDPTTHCALTHSAMDAVNEAYKQGIFFVKSAGNQNSSFSGTCNVTIPGTASGAMTIGAMNVTNATFTTSTDSLGMAGSSSRVPTDFLGRKVIDMVAPNGMSKDITPGTLRWDTARTDDDYRAFGGGTSNAAAYVSGATANMLDHLTAMIGGSLASEPGILRVSMLLGTDLNMANGWSGIGDGTWGHGRLRMRMFNAAGMDAPSRTRWIIRTVSDGQTVDDILLNPNSSGVNQVLPSGVDQVKVAVWFYEPNIAQGELQTAKYKIQLCSLAPPKLGGAEVCQGLNVRDNSRVFLDNTSVAGLKYFLRIEGTDVPASSESNYLNGAAARRIYIATMWEDTARNDGDGPAGDIE